jgi:hypothetical protein
VPVIPHECCGANLKHRSSVWFIFLQRQGHDGRRGTLHFECVHRCDPSSGWERQIDDDDIRQPMPSDTEYLLTAFRLSNTFSIALHFQEAAQAFTYQGMLFHKQDTEPAALWIILISWLDHLGHPHAPGARAATADLFLF